MTDTTASPAALDLEGRPSSEHPRHAKPTLYLGSVLTNFENGCQLDLRVKLAIEFIKAGAVPDTVVVTNFGPQPLSAAERATHALELACELIAQADEKGLVAGLPDDDSISSVMKKHIRRNVRANIYQQTCAQEIMQTDAPKIVAALGGIPPGAPN